MSDDVIFVAPPPRRCPQCGEATVVAVMYGFPTPEAVEAADRGEVEIGGCIVEDDNPTWRCRQCGRSWQKAPR